MVQLQDSELVTRSLDGERAAFGTLFQRYLPPVYDFVARLARFEHDAADVAMATFLTALERLPRITDRAAFRPWLFRIAYDQATARIRERGVAAVPGAGEVGVLSDEIDTMVWQTAMELDPATLAALDLHARHGFAPDEIASVLGADPLRGDRLVARMRDEVSAALPQLTGPIAAYADLGDVEVPPGLHAAIWVELESLWPPGRTRRGGGWRRAAVAVGVLVVAGVVGAWAAENLAPAASDQGVAGEDPDAAGDQGGADGDPAQGGTEPGSDGEGAGGATGDGSGAGDGSGDGSGRDGAQEVAPEGEYPAGSRPTTSDTGPGAPTVRIVEPEDGHVAIAEDLGDGTWAARVNASAEATDPDEQELEGRWWSDRHRQDLGSTARVSFWLGLADGCPGEPLIHTVTVAVTDPDGNTAVDSLDIEVRCP